MMMLENNPMLAELKKSMTTSIEQQNKDNNITKIEININTKDYKEIEKSKIVNNKINNIKTNDLVHSNKINNVTIMNLANNKKDLIIKRGEIWMVDLGNNGNSIQSGKHPFLVTSNNLNNQYSPNISGCSGTSKMTKAKLPVHVEIEGYGLKVKTIILCETLCPIDKSKFLYKMGEVDKDIMSKIKKAIDIQNGELIQKTPLERLPKDIQDLINTKLEDIRSVERTITNVQRDNLITHLMNERESQLITLEKICEQYSLNYKDYYTMYKKEEEKIAL